MIFTTRKENDNCSRPGVLSPMMVLSVASMLQRKSSRGSAGNSSGKRSCVWTSRRKPMNAIKRSRRGWIARTMVLVRCSSAGSSPVISSTRTGSTRSAQSCARSGRNAWEARKQRRSRTLKTPPIRLSQTSRTRKLKWKNAYATQCMTCEF